MRLVGTWTVTAVSGVTVPSGEQHGPWLTFDGDGQVFGMSGVNRVRGTWSVDGDVLTFGPLASTMMAGPPQAMALESALHGLLAAPLTLHTADGAAASSADPMLDPAASAAGRPAIVDLLASDGGSVELRRTTPRN
ncbi:META domain-containing protein [Cellulomonas sp. PhB150]|uniref:META domain-containing protein n=1 Tax=Cellulomonas sp. PhB150 TaxID=2485188 RepID=UPI000F48D472|nr:META domain-containing protein [Cellulomonas sp. PhB150]